MKRFLVVAVALAALGLSGANFLITEYEAVVSEALSSLKFESIPPQPMIVGAPPKMKVTKQTLAYLEKLMKDGKIIEIQGNGSIKVIDGNK